MDYLVSVVPPSDYWEVCQNDVPLTVDYQDTIAVDFAVQSVIECPLMEVEISGNSSFRLCDSTVLFINYCNDGTAIAEDVSVTIALPEELTYLSSLPLPAEEMDGTYIFELGDVGINECGVVSIEAAVTCDEVLLGNVACVSASILPDTVCTVPGSDWNGALLQADYTCEDGNVQFRIENVGTASTTTVLDYVIIEDAVLLLDGNFDLDPEQVHLSAAVPQNGATLHTSCSAGTWGTRSRFD